MIKAETIDNFADDLTHYTDELAALTETEVAVDDELAGAFYGLYEECLNYIEAFKAFEAR